MEQETQPSIIGLDSLIQDRHLQMMKAALPYFNNSSQKPIAFLIKFLELERTISIFNSPENTIQMCSVPQEETPLPLQLLGVIREFCTERERENIDMLLNYMQMFSAYETMFN